MEEARRVGPTSFANTEPDSKEAWLWAVATSDVFTFLADSVEDLYMPEDGEPVVVVLHQPNAVAGYLALGTPTLDEFKTRQTSLTTPVDDGIPDLPPGIVTYGHLHDPDGPWVVWNTDTADVTWTVVTQLGSSGGVEENPTFNRFSTPFSPPLKTVNVQLQYVDEHSGLQTGYTEIAVATDGTLTVANRIELGVPISPGG